VNENIRSKEGDLEGDGRERRAHASVERGGAVGAEDAAQHGGGGAVVRLRLLQADAERVEGVARQHAGHAADPAGDELPPAAARQELHIYPRTERSRAEQRRRREQSRARATQPVEEGGAGDEWKRRVEGGGCICGRATNKETLLVAMRSTPPPSQR
jgi:hypothetical protein